MTTEYKGTSLDQRESEIIYVEPSPKDAKKVTDPKVGEIIVTIRYIFPIKRGVHDYALLSEAINKHTNVFVSVSEWDPNIHQGFVAGAGIEVFSVAAMDGPPGQRGRALVKINNTWPNAEQLNGLVTVFVSLNPSGPSG